MAAIICFLPSFLYLREPSDHAVKDVRLRGSIVVSRLSVRIGKRPWCLSRSSKMRSASAGLSGPWRGEPTLEELLSEPIITALMDADGVDRNELEVMLRQVLSVP